MRELGSNLRVCLISQKFNKELSANMPKKFNKYFFAITPTGEIQEEATGLKLQLKEKFNLKYALKSPAHITLKMPFLWKENKEQILISQFSDFFNEQSSFNLKLGGIGNFRKRVVFVKVEKQEKLLELQKRLVNLCRTQCNLKVELSDYAFNPHMTLAFKDVKERFFEDYIIFLKSLSFIHHMEVYEVALLRKEAEERKWQVFYRFPLKTTRNLTC